MGKDNNCIQWFLEGEMRDNSPWIIPINDDFSIGRLESSDLILSSSSVSRKHANLIIDVDDLYITDLQSSNGTYINGQLLKGKTRLRNGDLLKIGISEFKVCSKEVICREQNDQTLVGSFEEPKDFEEFYNLSARESEILFFLIKGFNLQEIGDKLFISPGTVKNHVLKIYKKTDCHSRIELSTRYSEYKRE
ncbi:MAG: FHA domain-containing protein [Spirochaetaceae bacterium]|nr:FHA domain-containing protein [Spirochaetaceae bacterium]